MVIRNLSLAAVVLGMALTGTAYAEAPAVKFRVVGQPIATGLIQKNKEQVFFEQLEEKSNGMFVADYKPIDTLGIKDTEQLRVLKAGLFDIISLRVLRNSRDEPALVGLDLVGAGPDFATARKVFDAYTPELDRLLQKKFNSRLLGAWPFGAQILFCKKPIENLDSLHGLKVRVIDQNLSKVMETLGATPVPMSFPEVHQALALGVVDCAVTDPSSANSAGWPEVTTHQMALGFQMSPNAYVITEKAWQRMSSGQQAVLARDHALPPISLDFDVIGPMARSVSDAIDLFDIVAGPSPMDWRSWGASNAMRDAQRIGRRARKVFYCAGIEGFPVDPEISTHCEASLAIFRNLGFCIDSGPLPFPLRFTTDKWPMVGQVGLSWLFREYPEWGAGASEKYRDIARAGADQSAADLLQLLHETDLLRRDVAEFFNDYDFIVTPATASLPWEIGIDYPSTIDGIPVGPRGHGIFSAWVNACGIPAIALPAGMSASHLPLGIQLVGPYGSDARLLRLARQYELSRSVEYQWPDLVATI